MISILLARQLQLFNVVLKVYVCCIYNGKIRTLSQHRSFTYNEKKYKNTESQIKLGTSEPIGSVEFRRFPCDRIPIQFSSDEFRSVPRGSVDFQQISGRNFAESTGTFPAETGPESCRKEIVGTQRSRPKTNGIYRIRCRKTKKTIDSVGRNSGSWGKSDMKMIKPNNIRRFAVLKSPTIYHF